MPSDSQGTAAVTGRLRVFRLAARGPQLQGRLSRLVTSLSLLSEQEPQRAELLSAVCWRSRLLGKPCRGRPLLPKEASQGSRPGDSLAHHSSQPFWFQNCAWALPGFMGTDGAFIPAALFVFLGLQARLGTKNKKKEGRKEERDREKEKNPRLLRAYLRMSQEDVRVMPLTYLSPVI